MGRDFARALSSSPHERWLEELGWKAEGTLGRLRALSLQLRFGRRLSLATSAGLEGQLGWQIGPAGFVSLGPRSRIRRGADFKVDGELQVGEGTLIGLWCVLSVLESVRIGRDVLIAERVSIRDHDHRHRGEGPIAQQGYDVAPVRIGDGCWLGAGVVIGQGVELGEGCVVGANSVVLHSFGPGMVVVGAPARPVGQR